MASMVINPIKMAGCHTFSAMEDNNKPRFHSKRQLHLPRRNQQLSHQISSAVSTPTSFPSTSATSFTYYTETLPFSSSSSSPLTWREIRGCKNWEGLLDPLHPLLRDEIVRYGSFVTACYDAFDMDPDSKRYLNCKFGKNNLLHKVGFQNSNYDVTKYIYATPDVTIPIGPSGSSCGRWIGYVAVSSDAEVKRLGRRDIVVTFRGTVTNNEWVANMMSSLSPPRFNPHNPRSEVKVESGFLSLYTADESKSKFGIRSCRDQLLSEVSRLLNKYKGEKLSITLAGHSMGSSLALLLAYDISELGLNRNKKGIVPITVFSFGGPRVGNSGFKDRCEELGIKVLRVVNVNDPITKLPGVVFNENFRVLGGRYELPWSCSCYTHVGTELSLNFFDVQNPSSVHDLQTYLNLLKQPPVVLQRDGDIISPRNTVDLLQKAQEFVSNLDMLPWMGTASDVANLIPILSSTWI